MSNGLGAGFAAITLLAVLAGLSFLVALAAGTAYALHRRMGRIPWPLRLLVVVVGVVVLGVAGFGVLALFDEAPPVAGLLAATVLAPLLAVGGYLFRTMESPYVDVAATTVLAWGFLFLPGVAVAFGVTAGASDVLGLTTGESRRLGVPWLASAVGGSTVVLGMLIVGSRLREVFPISSDRHEPT